MLSTINMGGVTVTPDQLKTMHRGDYILHARDGKLTEIAVEKTQLPLDPAVDNHQQLGFQAAPDGTLYATQKTQVSKSIDGGKTWTHKYCKIGKNGFGGLQGFGTAVNQEGRLLFIGEPWMTTWSTDDDGETWYKAGEFDTSFEKQGYDGSCLRLPDGTLMIPIQSRDGFEAPESCDTPEDVANFWRYVIRGAMTLYYFRSKDGGKTFPYRSTFGDWCHETNATLLPSGRMLAAIRYQRPQIPEDPPDILERTGAPPRCGMPYKHVFLADSDDNGLTWNNMRQLTTLFGQCHGFPTGLTNNRVVVCHDNRLPEEVKGGRAMVSHDDGKTFEDEVYYLCHGVNAGHARTVTLDGEEMLTMVGANQKPIEPIPVGQTPFFIIRWRLV